MITVIEIVHCPVVEQTSCRQRKITNSSENTQSSTLDTDDTQSNVSDKK